jgi:hypothetical protein
VSHLQVLLNGKPMLSETVDEIHIDHNIDGTILVKANQTVSRSSDPLGLSGPTGTFLDGLLEMQKPSILKRFNSMLSSCVPRPVGFPIAATQEP